MNDVEEPRDLRRIHIPGQRLDRLALRIGQFTQRFFSRRRIADRARHEQMAQLQGQLLNEPLEVHAATVKRLDLRQDRGRVAMDQRRAQIQRRPAIDGAQSLSHLLIGRRLATGRKHHVQHRQRVAHPALGLAHDKGDGAVGKLRALLAENLRQTPGHAARRNAAKIMPLAAREDRVRQLVRLGGGEDELHMRRRLLKRLEQCVEGLRGQHVNFVDDVDFVAVSLRQVGDALADLAHVLDAVVRGAVDFSHIERCPGDDLATGQAFTAGRGGRPLFAVERAGKESGRCGLADAARSAKQIGVRHAPLSNGIGQRADDVLLARHRVEGLRPPFPGENEITHDMLLQSTAPIHSASRQTPRISPNAPMPRRFTISPANQSKRAPKARLFREIIQTARQARQHPTPLSLFIFLLLQRSFHQAPNLRAEQR